MTIAVDITYKVRPNYRFSDKDAAVIGPELERILETTGALTPENMLRAATPKQSALHKYVFNVEPGEAAKQYYLSRCRYIAKAIVITVPTKDGDATVPAFYSLNLSDERPDQEYLPLREVLTDPDLLRRQMFRFRRDMQRIKDEYATFRLVAAFEEKAGKVLDAVEEHLSS